MVIAPRCRCRLCRRDEMEIKQKDRPRRAAFLLPFFRWWIGSFFAPSESHKNAHKSRYFFALITNITEPKNATQRATESDRTKHQNTAAGAEARTAAPTRRQKKDRHRLRRERSKFRFRPSKFYLSKFQNLRSNFTLSNFHLQRFQGTFLQAQPRALYHREGYSE